MHALLELDCIPAGMELFPAANEDQWSLIQQVIDDCDYYIVILGGRYGSTRPDGTSYTELEYQYAIERGKPVIAFVHKSPGDLPANKTEMDAAKRARLDAFRTLVQQKTCKAWVGAADLGSVVSRSLVKLIKAHPAVGWVRGDMVPSGGAAQEMLRLQRRIEDLEGQLEHSRTTPPPAADGLAQGRDVFKLEYEYNYSDHEGDRFTGFGAEEVSWEAIFAQAGPLMIDRAADSDIKATLSSWTKDLVSHQLWQHNDMHSLRGVTIADRSYHTIIIQLRALGLIVKEAPRTVRDARTYWTLTPYGDSALTSLRAIRRPV